ncbi:MAG: hypothetical protein J6W17_03935 [Campylobacter sp.]|nr:hypothetical protein [Campylobacter sp.]
MIAHFYPSDDKKALNASTSSEIPKSSALIKYNANSFMANFIPIFSSLYVPL